MVKNVDKTYYIKTLVCMRKMLAIKSVDGNLGVGPHENVYDANRYVRAVFEHEGIDAAVATAYVQHRRLRRQQRAQAFRQNPSPAAENEAFVKGADDRYVQGNSNLEAIVL